MKGSSASTIDEVRKIAMSLPRTEEHLIRGQVKFRIRSIVYVALSRDQTPMGFAFPKELRSALVEGEPDKFELPRASDLRWNWVCVRLAAIDKRELRMLITEAWRMVVPAVSRRRTSASSLYRQRPKLQLRAAAKTWQFQLQSMFCPMHS